MIKLLELQHVAKAVKIQRNIDVTEDTPAVPFIYNIYDTFSLSGFNSYMSTNSCFFYGKMCVNIYQSTAAIESRVANGYLKTNFNTHFYNWQEALFNYDFNQKSAINYTIDNCFTGLVVSATNFSYNVNLFGYAFSF